MTDTVYVLVPAEEPVPIDELHELTASENISPFTREDGLHGYIARWDDVTLKISFPLAAEQKPILKQMLERVDHLLDERKDKKARKIWRRAERMEQVIICEVTPDWDEARKAQMLVQGVMAYYDYALLYAEDTIYNENGNIEVGGKNARPKYWEQAPDESETREMQARKKRSLTQLKGEGVPTIDHLRPLPDDDQITLRSAHEVAQRAIALNLIARRADGESKDWYWERIKRYQLDNVVTEQERVFADDPEPPEYIVIMFSQRLEAFWLLAWALQLIPNLSRPDNFANHGRAHELLDTRSLDQFLLDAKLRDKATIMDQWDLHFRYHWAVVDAELYGKKPPTKLEPDVVYQRHYAFNWLTQYRDQTWDEITTDT